MTLQNKLQRISTTEAVVNFIKEQIRTRALQPGDYLPPEHQLQEQLGISKFALREGMARLRALGIISSGPGRRSIVNRDVNEQSLNDVFFPLEMTYTDKYVKDLFATRILIETESAALAALDREEHHLHQMRELLLLMKEPSLNPQQYAEYDFQFHHQIVEAGGNLFLVKIHGFLQRQLAPLILRTVTEAKHREISRQWHTKIYAAIEEKNVELAKGMMRSHLEACQIAYEEGKMIDNGEERKRIVEQKC